MEILIKHYGKTLKGSECRMVAAKYDLTREETANMWTSFDLGDMDGLSDEQVQILLQDRIDEEINRPERNSFSRQEKLVDHYFAVNYQSEGDGCENLEDKHSPQQKEENEEFDELCDRIRSLLYKKPEWAEIVIDKVLRNKSFVAIGKETNQSEDSVRKKYNRAIQKLQKCYPKRPD